MKTLLFLMAMALVQISALDNVKAEGCSNFTGTYRFQNTMTVIFNQKSCSDIDVAWGSDYNGNRVPQPFSLLTSDFKKDPSQGFGASIMSYRYNIIGRSLIMSYKSDGSQQIEGYAFTVNKDGTLSVGPL